MIKNNESKRIFVETETIALTMLIFYSGEIPLFDELDVAEVENGRHHLHDVPLVVSIETDYRHG